VKVTVTILLVWSVLAHAQTYPSKPIRLIVPFPPAETMDVMSRLIGPKMSERLGQPVVIENRPGASGMLGLDLVAKSAPDGYTIGAGQGGNMVILPHTSRHIPYDVLKDFAPIALSTTNYLAIVGSLNAPFKNIGEMVAYAKANPGKLTVATNGEGGFPHLAFEHLRTLGGFTFTHVPYKGASAIVTDIVGGQVLTGVTSIATATPHVKSGRVRLLAVTNATRVALWQDVPYGQPVTKRTLEQFVATEINHPSSLHDACFIAVKDGEYIGYSRLIEAEDGFNTDMTGVLRAYRGMGLATLLKLRGIRYTQEHGGRRVSVVNDAVNVAMLGLN